MVFSSILAACWPCHQEELLLIDSSWTAMCPVGLIVYIPQLFSHLSGVLEYQDITGNEIWRIPKTRNISSFVNSETSELNDRNVLCLSPLNLHVSKIRAVSIKRQTFIPVNDKNPLGLGHHLNQLGERLNVYFAVDKCHNENCRKTQIRSRTRVLM